MRQEFIKGVINFLQNEIKKVFSQPNDKRIADFEFEIAY